MSDSERYQAVTAARERFLAGDDRVRGVRPEVATSWYRCREQYHVDPGLSKAPQASALEESHSQPRGDRFSRAGFANQRHLLARPDVKP